MAFYHRNFATQGLFPGITTHRSVANLGHYEIEVIIRPVTPGGGGGGWLHPLKDREIIVRVRKGDSVWEATYTTSKYFADPIITVTAGFRTLRRLMSNIAVSARTLGTRAKQIWVNIIK